MAKRKSVNKRKIFNDPIYGFININDDLIFDLIEHPYYQRLRRIKQLGLTHLVYPGALHTRFHHALGAMHLMSLAIEVIRSKGQKITEEEAQGVTIAILLHDVGHGPFSHALEHSIVDNINHELLSELFMNKLNEEFNGKLSLAIKIFKNEYKKKFLHQLVSSQLDMDRLDYLQRDSFYTGVSEGVIGYDRLIKMINVVNDALVMEAKGIYSIENFIIARRLMYWQVYLHKTVLAAENQLVNVLKRATELANKGVELFCTPALQTFLYNKYGIQDFEEDPALLDTFAQLDDYDIMSSIKVWCDHPDPILSALSESIVNRKLYHTEIQDKAFAAPLIKKIKSLVKSKYKVSDREAKYFVLSSNVANSAYSPEKIRINILQKEGQIEDIAKASDQLNISALSKPVKKYFLCYPKDIHKKL